MEPVADQFPITPVRQKIYCIWNDTISGNFRGMDRASDSEQSRTDLLY